MCALFQFFHNTIHKFAGDVEVKYFIKFSNTCWTGNINFCEVIANDILFEFQHPVAGRLRQTRTAANFEGTPPDLSRGAPRLGEHNFEILTELGFSEREIAELRDRGAIGAESYSDKTENWSV